MAQVPRWTVLALHATGCLLGCSELPDIQWRGEHVDFAAENTDQVCGGTREYLDQRAGSILEKLGQDHQRIEYYLLEDVDDFCSHDDIASGCSEPGVVYSEMVPHLHELVHARSGDRMPLVLEEGLATYLGDPYPIRELAPRERMAEMLMSDVNGIDTAPEYARAAHFMAFLTETFGWETVLELDALLGSNSGPAELNSAFQTVVGDGLDAVLTEYGTYPDCVGFVDTSIACSSTPVSLDFLHPTHERLIDCASAEGVGPHQGMVFVEDVIELAPSIDGSRIVAGTGDGIEKGGFALLRRCGPCSENAVGIIDNGIGVISEADLPAGRYLVRFYLPIDVGPAVVGIQISG